MKKIFAFLMFSFILTSAFSQIDVKINPLGVLFKSPDLAAEYIISDNIGVELSAGITYGNVALSTTLGDEFALKRSGYRIRLSGKYYFSPKNGGDRFYAGLYTGPRSNTISGDPEVYTYDPGYTRSAFAVGILLGYKVVAANGLLFDVGLGFGRALASKVEFTDTVNNPSVVDPFGLDAVFSLAVGYRIGGGGSSSSGSSRKKR